MSDTPRHPIPVILAILANFGTFFETSSKQHICFDQR